ncbi:hypothetical protein AHF37_09373 [Paragonimus kellicotti]|nr:hypothetical protein AHF37_09373 [Paragonimus kellicotti]
MGTCYDLYIDVPSYGARVLSEELRHMRLNILNLTTCNKTKAYKGGLTPSMLCAGYMDGERDSCQGDSGGPLMCQDETDKRWYQIGVVSFGKECAGISLSSVHTHPNYGQKAHFDNDIALLRLNITAQFQRTIKPVCLLPNQHHPVDGATFDIEGELLRCWLGSHGIVLSEELRHMRLNILSLTTCNKTKAYKGGLTPSMLCAGYMDGERDSCQGDSGGPLMCQDETDKRWYQIGVVSFGKECAAKEAPGIYSRVSKGLPWITSVINSE